MSLEYRGTQIRTQHWQGRKYYAAWYTPAGARLARCAATDDDCIGIMRAVDDWISTGRPQHRTAA